MLVLARRPDETIVFPNVGITLRVIRVKGQVVRLGIDAPQDISILRGEISPVDAANSPTYEPAKDRANSPAEPPRQSASAEWNHTLRNRLNFVQLSTQLLQKLIEDGRSDETADKFADLLTELQALDELLDSEQDDSPATQLPEAVRVLIVDDQENERKLLGNLLEMQGCQVDTVGDGVAAMEYLDTHERPDLVLLDMSMPRCNGPQFLETLRNREEFRDLRVFAVSGHTSKSAGVPVGPDGVDGWFRKPLNTKNLLSSMNAVAQA